MNDKIFGVATKGFIVKDNKILVKKEKVEKNNFFPTNLCLRKGIRLI